MTTNEHNKETQIDNEQLKVKYDQHVSIPMKSPRGTDMGNITSAKTIKLMII